MKRSKFESRIKGKYLVNKLVEKIIIMVISIVKKMMHQNQTLHLF